jgi:hypothetical protein
VCVRLFVHTAVSAWSRSVKFAPTPISTQAEQDAAVAIYDRQAVAVSRCMMPGPRCLSSQQCICLLSRNECRARLKLTAGPAPLQVQLLPR